jgi:hypothetical protein
VKHRDCAAWGTCANHDQIRIRLRCDKRQRRLDFDVIGGKGRCQQLQHLGQAISRYGACWPA